MLFSFKCSSAQFIKSRFVPKIACCFLKKASKNSGVIGVSMPTFLIYFFAILIFSITLSEQLDAPKLKRISSRPASPNAFNVSSVAKVPFVYKC